MRDRGTKKEKFGREGEPPHGQWREKKKKEVPRGMLLLPKGGAWGGAPPTTRPTRPQPQNMTPSRRGKNSVRGGARIGKNCTAGEREGKGGNP